MYLLISPAIHTTAPADAPSFAEVCMVRLCRSLALDSLRALCSLDFCLRVFAWLLLCMCVSTALGIYSMNFCVSWFFFCLQFVTFSLGLRFCLLCIFFAACTCASNSFLAAFLRNYTNCLLGIHPRIRDITGYCVLYHLYHFWYLCLQSH